MSSQIDKLTRMVGRLRGLAYGLAGAMAKEATGAGHQQEGEDAWTELAGAEFGAGLEPPLEAEPEEDLAEALERRAARLARARRFTAQPPASLTQHATQLAGNNRPMQTRTSDLEERVKVLEEKMDRIADRVGRRASTG